jgi:LIM homeobox transcription factor 1
VCAACLSPLQKGEQFVLRGSQIFCRADFEKELFLLQQANSPRGMIITFKL